MDSLFIYDQTFCHCLNVNSSIEYEGFFIYIKQKQCVLEKDKFQAKLKKGQSIQIESKHYLFLEEEWSILPMKEYKIGRNTSCDLSFKYPLLSNMHAYFSNDEKDWFIHDCLSKNGTYLNSRRIKTSKLKDADEICMANLRFFFFHNFLLINQRMISDFVPFTLSYKSSGAWSIQDKRMEIEHPILKMEIEMPVSAYSQKKPHLFHSIGSSFSILISSLLFSILRYWMEPESIDQLKTMMMTSGSMFLAFFSYGIWNHKQRIKEISLNENKRKELYLSYLQEKKCEIWGCRQVFLEQEEKLKDQCLKWNENTYGIKHPLWMGKQKGQWIEIQHSKLSYSQKEDELVQKVNNEINEWEKPILRNQFLQRNKKNVLLKEDNDLPLILFVQWLWQKPSKEEKWVWIDPDLKKTDRLFSLAYCQLNRMRLLARSLEEWNILKKHLDPSYEYILCSRIKDCSWKKEATWIYYSQALEKKESYFERIRSYIDHRKIPIQRNQMENFTLDWQNPKASLRVDIGTSCEGTKIFLDFKDGKQGPHGIVAGMTGSGKSEWLSSVLMKLLLKNNPDQLQYILIDFKGGAFGQAFYMYPHCAGMVTNLEEHSINRWMQSMEFEIKKRQRILRDFLQENQNAIAHVDFYNLYKEKPISHLFVIFDEYAEFKSQYPDCAIRVKEMARIGRSLGIHLLICTQKPMGVIDEQIWSNSSFQVCLKVNSEADSREVIHDGKAAYLKQAGQFILFADQKYAEGKGDYLHEKIFDSKHPVWCEVDENDQMIVSKEYETQSILEWCSQQIFAQKKKRRWILCPDLLEQESMKALLKIDDPSHQRQVDYEMKKGEKMYLYWSNEMELKLFLSSFVAQYQEELILCMGYTELKDYVDGIIDSYEQIDNESGTLIINCSNKEEFQSYSNSKFRLLYLISNPWLTFHQDCMDGTLISLSWLDIDVIRLFFNALKIPKVKTNSHLALVQDQQEILTCRFIEKAPKRIDKKRIQCLDKQYVLGKDASNGQTVLWKRENPLLILYAQKSCEKWIFNKIQEFLEINPLLSYHFDFNQSADLYVIYVNQSNPFYQEPLYIENQYDFDILWIGLGLSDFSHLIKRKCPYQLRTKMVYWTNQTMIECDDE